MFSKTFRGMSKGELDEEKPSLLEFIKETPADKIAYIGQHRVRKGDGSSVYELYKERRPLMNK
jgi:hypothetical protein